MNSLMMIPMTPSKKYLWLLLLILLINLTALGTMFYLYLNPPPPALPQNHMPHKHQRLEKLLRFDETQKTQFKNLRQQHRAASKEIRNEVHKRRKVLLGELTAPQADTLRIKQINHELSKFHEDMQNMLAMHLISVRLLCKQEQLARFDSTVAQIMMCSNEFGPPSHPSGRNHKQTNCSTKINKNEN
jgi:Spy/CpxP family protein refolding chaperone